MINIIVGLYEFMIKVFALGIDLLVFMYHIPGRVIGFFATDIGAEVGFFALVFYGTIIILVLGTYWLYKPKSFAK